jgi:hypothetical protein
MFGACGIFDAHELRFNAFPQILCYLGPEVCMPLLIVIFALLIPRVTIALLYFFTNWFQGVFSNLVIPILGFIFLPTTLLWYSAVQKWFHGEWGIVSVAGIVIALIIDLSPARKRRALEKTA